MGVGVADVSVGDQLHALLSGSRPQSAVYRCSYHPLKGLSKVADRGLVSSGPQGSRRPSSSHLAPKPVQYSLSLGWGGGALGEFTSRMVS